MKEGEEARLSQWWSHESVLTSYLLLTTVVYLTVNNQTCYLGKGKNIAHFLFSILASTSMIPASGHGLKLNKPKKQMFIATLRTSPSICCIPREMYKEAVGMVRQGRVPKKNKSSPREMGVEKRGPGEPGKGIGVKEHRKGSNYPQAN